MQSLEKQKSVKFLDYKLLKKTVIFVQYYYVYSITYILPLVHTSLTGIINKTLLFWSSKFIQKNLYLDNDNTSRVCYVNSRVFSYFF